MNAHVPVIPRRVSEIIDEYQAKADNAQDAVDAYRAAEAALGSASTVCGKYVRPMVNDRVRADANEVRRNLLASAWRALYDTMQIDRLASADDRRRFERLFAAPPPLSIVTVREHFGDYILRPRHNILRGLAEVFCALDPAYRSHSNVKIGVSRLPKRIILSSFGSYGSYGRDHFRDLVNAMAALRGQPLMMQEEILAINDAHRAGDDAILHGAMFPRLTNSADGMLELPNRGLTIRKFQNGNAHVFFSPAALRDVNMALAEFYGDVLPDTPDEPSAKQPGTAVAKDLQFYPTPAKVIATILDEVGIYALDGYRNTKRALVLEPSCGDGRVMEAIRQRGHQLLGVEVDPARAAQARAKGLNVVTGNFLEQPPEPIFDFVVMNPPFYGRHYVKHVRHALRFLKPGGRLVSVLPASAHYDHKELTGKWEDLPVASFAESGTNIPTGYLIMGANQ
jgi:SAM-dependent methyltransferase